MTDVNKLYDWLASDPRAEADAILVAALRHAEPEYVERLAAVLLRRKTDAAWAGLVAEYDRLSAEARAPLLAAPDLLRAGVAAALRNEEPGGRRGPLRLLTEHPQPQLLHLVADALRDPTTEIKEAAARVIRMAAEAAATADEGRADHRPPVRDRCHKVAATADEGRAAPSAAGTHPDTQRAAVVQGLREALRTYDLHFRLEVLEACLWFARDLGDTLWSMIDTRRSHAAYAITERLEAWNHPRLAGFLLTALGRPSWRRAAHTLLSTWSTRDELLAILAHTDVLDDPNVRENVRLLKAPRWLAAAGPGLAHLPPRAAAQLPRWLGRLDFTSGERLRCLTSWLTLPRPEVQRAVVYALADLNSVEAVRVLAEVARRPGPMAPFARWFITGWRAAHESGGGSDRNAAPMEATPCRRG